MIQNRSNWEPRQLDVVAIGALNIDYIVDGTALSSDMRHNIAATCGEIRWGSETAVESGALQALCELLSPRIRLVRLGGSAFNAMSALKTIRPRVRVGFVGATGEAHNADGFRRWFAAHDVDTEFVRFEPETISGACVAIEAHGERTLITTTGANDLATQMLCMEADEIANWASKSRLLHVSSLLDVNAPQAVVEVLSRYRARNPTAQISIDPGADWARGASGSKAIQGLIAMADLLFVNCEEFACIWGGGDMSGDACAQRLNTAASRPGEVLLKEPDGLTLFSPARQKWCKRSHTIIPADQIQDATGAGDILAGAYLASRLRGEVHWGDGLASASAIVEATLRHGVKAKADYESIFANS